MLFKDYKKSYVEFCNEEIRKRIILEKRDICVLKRNFIKNVY